MDHRDAPERDAGYGNALDDERVSLLTFDGGVHRLPSKFDEFDRCTAIGGN
jgi:hypothetical protein